MIKTYWQESISRGGGGSWLITFTIVAKINVKIKVPSMTVFKFKTSQMVNEGLFAFKPQKVSKIYDTLEEGL